MAFPWPAIWTFLQYASLPLVWILKAIYNVLKIIAAPFRILGGYVIHVLKLPFRFLARFEPLFIYFGVALLVGMVTGILLHYSSRILNSVLDLDDEEREPQPVTTPATFRKEQEEKRSKRAQGSLLQNGMQTRLDNVPMEEYSDWMKLDSSNPKSPIGLMSTTILEEDDSSDAGLAYSRLRR